MTTESSPVGFVILPFLTEEPEVTKIPEKGLLPDIARVAQTYHDGGLPVFRFHEGQWQIRQSADTKRYLPAQLRADHSALVQWRRAGVGHLFPEDKQATVQTHLITDLMHNTLTEVPQYFRSIRQEGDLIDEYHAYLQNPEAHSDFDERQWTCDYLRVRRTAIRACKAVGGFLKAQMDDLILTQEVDRTIPYQYLLQAQLVGLILQLAGTYVGANARFPEPIRLRHLMRLMYNGHLLTPEDLKPFESLCLPTEPEAEQHIKGQLAEIRMTHDAASSATWKISPRLASSRQ